ncbi:hypothetical protein [Aliiglaciecola aliphaticivorans]
MTEVGGDAAIYVESEILTQAAEIIHSQLHAEKDLKTKSIVNAKYFSMKAMIAAYIAEYNQVCSQKVEV